MRRRRRPLGGRSPRQPTASRPGRGQGWRAQRALRPARASGPSPRHGIATAYRLPFTAYGRTDAQHGIFEQDLQELNAGHKRSHWMWFIFPQLAGLGFSAMAERYAIGSLEEARAYLQHPLLGERLRVCTAAVNGVRGRTASQVFGSPDDMKFRSSMTLFDLTDPAQPTFRQALERYYGGVQDPLTLALLAGTRSQPYTAHRLP